MRCPEEASHSAFVSGGEGITATAVCYHTWFLCVSIYIYLLNLCNCFYFWEAPSEVVGAWRLFLTGHLST